MIYLKLYIVFFKIGLLAFGGGYAVLPLIEYYLVQELNWITSNTMLDIISISQITPGPIAINSASFVGQKIGGILGSIIASIGVISPQLILIFIFIYFIGNKNKYIKLSLKAISVAVTSFIIMVAFNLTKLTLTDNKHLLFSISFIFFSMFLLHKKVNSIKIILLGGVLGLVLF